MSFKQIAKYHKKKLKSDRFTLDQKKALRDQVRVECVACVLEDKGYFVAGVHDNFGAWLCEEHYQIVKAKREALNKANDEKNAKE